MTRRLKDSPSPSGRGSGRGNGAKQDVSGHPLLSRRERETRITPYSATLWEGRTVGLLGGSFNPAHEGHRHISLYALKMLGLDAVWWMVSPQNPLKSAKDMASLHTRLRDASAVAAHPKIFVTDIESQMGTRFTADTLKALKKHFPRTRFIWLMGADNLHQFHRWKNWQEIFRAVPVCVLARPPQGNLVRASKAVGRFRGGLTGGPLAGAKLPALKILHIPLNAQSATAIRSARKNRG